MAVHQLQLDLRYSARSSQAYSCTAGFGRVPLHPMFTTIASLCGAGSDQSCKTDRPCLHA